MSDQKPDLASRIARVVLFLSKLLAWDRKAWGGLLGWAWSESLVGRVIGGAARQIIEIEAEREEWRQARRVNELEQASATERVLRRFTYGAGMPTEPCRIMALRGWTATEGQDNRNPPKGGSGGSHPQPLPFPPPDFRRG